MSERLHKVLARCGVASRRKAEELIAQGRVHVNGEVVTGMGIKVDDTDEIKVDGRRLLAPNLVYVLLHKPKGYVTTLSDPQRRQTILDLLPDMGTALKPVGRLDMDTSGLLLCTNDGELIARLTHPRYGVEKEYVAVVKGIVVEKTLQKLRKGVYLAEEKRPGVEPKARPARPKKTAPAGAEVISTDTDREESTLSLVLHEGQNRQVRRMCLAVGHPVRSLKRVRMGFLTLGKLAPGKVRLLSKPEVKRLRELAGLGSD